MQETTNSSEAEAKLGTVIEKRRNVLNLIEKADGSPNTQGNINKLKRLDEELSQEFKNWQSLSEKTDETLKLDGHQLREESLNKMTIKMEIWISELFYSFFN